MSNESNNSTPNHKQQSQGQVKNISEKFSVMSLLDPRSPTTAFQRTPIQIILRNSRTISAEKPTDEISPETASLSSASFVSLSTPETIEDNSLELSASSASYLSLENLTDIDSINFSSTDLSMMVSDFSSYKEEMEKEPSNIIRDEIDRSMEESIVESESILEEKSTITPNFAVTPLKTNSRGRSIVDSDSMTDSVESVPLIKKKPLKNIFYTPNPNKKRNPLGPVDNVCPITPPSHLSYSSPQNVLCEKQWKRIQEERKKLGLEADENSQLPLYDITASAPSKLIRKSRLQTRFNGVVS